MTKENLLRGVCSDHHCCIAGSLAVPGIVPRKTRRRGNPMIVVISPAWSLVRKASQAGVWVDRGTKDLGTGLP